MHREPCATCPTERGDWLSGEAITRPADKVVGKLSEQDEHLLGLEVFLVSLGETQSLFTAFDGCFGSAATAVVGVQGGQQGSSRFVCLSMRVVRQPEEHLIGQVEDQDVIAPLAILPESANAQLAGGSVVHMDFFNPTDFSVGYLRVRMPGRHRPAQLLSTPPIFNLYQDMEVAAQQPVDIFVAPPPPSTRRMVRLRKPGFKPKTLSAS